MIQVCGQNITIEDVYQVAHHKKPVELTLEAREKMQISRAYIEKRLESDEAIYGVNTGFGHFSDVKISHEQIIELQKNLIRSHCMGIGDPFTKEETRAIMLLRANALARGHSGIRPLVVDTILNYLNSDIVPVIPQKGSVGASGDLAPLSHLALAIIGEGKVWGDNGDVVPVSQLLSQKNVQPLELQAKEGLSMINGCQVMTAVGLLNLYRGRRLMWLADLSGAMTLEALKGTRSAFDPLISATRPHPGEAKTARNILKLMGETSPISESHIDCGRVQDAYSLRCIPAVHGAAKDSFRHILKVLETEANSSTDNPLVFAEDGKILSCGNFHGEPVAYALDFAAIAMSGIGNISECRIEKMINPSMSSLPAFLAPEGGLNSGHMIVQVAAASLVSENKILSHPASVDSIPTSADKEDHVSMGTIAARKFGSIVDNTEHIIAMEMLSSTQALDMIKPLEPAAAVKATFDKIRETVPFAEKDRVFSDDVQNIQKLINDDSIFQTVHSCVGELEW
ncbi:MAG: histidine ammonia-lyase [Pseudomonadota bacterium]